MKMTEKILLAAAFAMIMSGCGRIGENPAKDVLTEPPETATIPGITAPEVTESPETTTEETSEITTGEIKTSPDVTEAEVTTDPLDFAFEPLAAAMYATDTVNVRELPSTESKVVGQLNPGDEAEVVGRIPSGEWYVVNYNGSRACVYAEYLSAEKPEVKKEEVSLPENYYFKNDSDYLFVVNKEIYLPEDYSIETDFVQGSYELETVAASHCRQMIEDAKKDGIDLKVLSAYRTVDYQTNLFNRNVKQRMDDMGMSYDEAVYDVSINIAPPGGSEHNAGLAVDIIDRDHWDTYEEFENTKEFDWLISHCTDYGFILRYPKGKEDITGYIYEPWHYRYVGLESAKKVMDSGLCLEEYMAN